MTPRNEIHRAAKLPRAVCQCDHWAIYDGDDRCSKCGKLWPAAYGRAVKQPGYKLLMAAVDRHRAKRRR